MNNTMSAQNTDLFECMELLPLEVQQKFESVEELKYETVEQLKGEVEQLGFTFDYYLDATPYNLRKLENHKEKPKIEDFYDANDPRGMSTSEYNDYLTALNKWEKQL